MARFYTRTIDSRCVMCVIYSTTTSLDRHVNWNKYVRVDEISIEQGRAQTIFLICFTALHCVLSFHSIYCMPGCFINTKYATRMAWALACLIKISRTTRTSTYFIWTYMSDYYTDVCGETSQTRETALRVCVGSQQWGRGAQFASSVFFFT